MSRSASISRTTKESSITIELDLDGGEKSISTGFAFFDHMLDQIASHGSFGLRIAAEGDLEVDTHHTVEDVGIALGACFGEALGDKAGVRRFAHAACPLDEALVDVHLDLSGRPFLLFDVAFPGHPIFGNPIFDPQLCEEFWRAFCTNANITMHIALIRGHNTHHIIESMFKGAARALREAAEITGSEVPSTKGVL